MRAPDMPNGWPMAMAPPLTLRRWSCQHVAAVDHLAGEGLVDLPQADVRPRVRPKRLSSWAPRTPGPMPSSLRRAAGHGDAAIDAERHQAAACRLGAADQEGRRGAVGELRGVAGGDELALLHPLAPSGKASSAAGL